MIALCLLLVGAALIVYGYLWIDSAPVGKKADGLLIALVGFALAFTGLIVGFVS